ncbi:hypothetical protein BDR05DRAFT_233749 [Suillus weaverae]|nr:hypothetical protein BDR05DRAFT_233749 [Suillus weaverae]
MRYTYCIVSPSTSATDPPCWYIIATFVPNHLSVVLTLAETPSLVLGPYQQQPTSHPNINVNIIWSSNSSLDMYYISCSPQPYTTTMKATTAKSQLEYSETSPALASYLLSSVSMNLQNSRKYKPRQDQSLATNCQLARDHSDYSHAQGQWVVNSMDI